MRPLRVWKQLLGLRRTVVEQVDFDELDEVVGDLGPPAREGARSLPALPAALPGV